MSIAATDPLLLSGFSPLQRFASPDWNSVPDAPGVYVIYDRGEVLYVGMAGREILGVRDETPGRETRFDGQSLTPQ